MELTTYQDELIFINRDKVGFIIDKGTSVYVSVNGKVIQVEESYTEVIRKFRPIEQKGD